MGDAVSFAKAREERSENVYACNMCDCVTFYLLEDGRIRCAKCKITHPDLEGDYRPRLTHKDHVGP